MAERDLNQEMETLREDVAKLRADLAGVAATLKDAGKGRVDDAKSSLVELVETLRDELRKGVAGARDRGRRSVETVEQQIEQKPLTALLTAFGVGVLLGKILDRR